MEALHPSNRVSLLFLCHHDEHDAHHCLTTIIMSPDEKKHNVVISPLALTTMLLHAAKHGTKSVHGVLVGTFSAADTVKVISAVPVCHEAPTKPLIDTALALVDHGVVVGWYTAPERLEDERPGAPALRIAASLGAAGGDEPVLIVLQNQAVADCLNGDTSTSVIKAYGKDFGQQWMEPLEVSLQSEVKALEAAKQAHHDQKVVLNDLVDHWEGKSAATEWFPSAAVAKCVEHVL